MNRSTVNKIGSVIKMIIGTPSVGSEATNDQVGSAFLSLMELSGVPVYVPGWPPTDADKHPYAEAYSQERYRIPIGSFRPLDFSKVDQSANTGGYGSMEQQTIARLQVENEKLRHRSDTMEREWSALDLASRVFCPRVSYDHEHETGASLLAENAHFRRVITLQGRSIESLRQVRHDNATMKAKLEETERILDDLRGQQRRYHDVYAKNQVVADENKQLQTVVTVAGEKIRELEQRLRQIIPSKDAQEAIVAGLLALVSSQFCSSQVLSERKNEIEDYMHAAFVAHHWADKASA